MLSKKHNDPFYWKNKLEALDCLPGEAAIEKNVIWERLDTRLHKKTTSNKAIWYWMAAGLIPLIVIVFTITDNTTDILAKQATEKNEHANTTIAVSSPASKEVVTLSVAAPVEMKPPVINSIPNKKIKDTIKTYEDINAVSVTKEPEVKLTRDSILTGDTALAIATAAPVKKKLPVIHINELETLQFATPVNFAGNLSGIKPKKNKTNNQNITLTENRIGFNIKLSSKN